MLKTVQQIFIENDADRDGYLTKEDITKMHRKMSERHKGNKSIKILS